MKRYVFNQDLRLKIEVETGYIEEIDCNRGWVWWSGEGNLEYHMTGTYHKDLRKALQNNNKAYHILWLGVLCNKEYTKNKLTVIYMRILSMVDTRALS